MLMEEYILKNDFFNILLQKNTDIIDSLTRTIKREFILKYIEYLLLCKKEFYLGIVDLDNFKMVNDTYGHSAGDQVLKSVAENVMAVASDTTVIGRFGGDEFILVLEDCNNYDDCWEEMKVIYRTGIRKLIQLESSHSVSMTATSGLASYPNDAATFNLLFDMCDKCLYRGKFKGRNCYIIYVESKHKDIMVNAIKKTTLLDRINQLYEVLDNTDRKKLIYKMLNYVCSATGITGGVYLSTKNVILEEYVKNISYGSTPVLPEAQLKILEKQDRIVISNSETIRYTDRTFYNFCEENNLLSLVIYKLKAFGKFEGYIMLYDSDYRRLWQEEDLTLFKIATKTISYFLNENKPMQKKTTSK